MRWLVPYLRVRLGAALGVEPGAVAEMLLRRRARVFVTAAHVDAVFSLDELPVEVRRAGLDRDPGWVPAGGRFVAFHYE
jgi:hypothetical protein